MARKSKAVTCELIGERIICRRNYEALHHEGHFGKVINGKLELSLVEALYLLKKKWIRLRADKKTLDFDSLFKLACKIDKRLPFRYRVYEDLRNRGFVVKTGFKYGCDFRVYERGVKPKRGPKTPREHTKWVVFCVPEIYTCSFHELARAVRLAQNIRARMLWAVVDEEGDVTYYEVVRIVP